jgi:hypothetical protein
MTLLDEKHTEQENSAHVECSKLEPNDASLKEQNTNMDDEQWRTAEKSLVRKLDFTLVPMVWLLYFFNYLDRNNIAYVPYYFSAEPLNPNQTI